jgi:anti-anti-sigma factor
MKGPETGLRRAGATARVASAGLAVARALGKTVVTVRGPLDRSTELLLHGLLDELAETDCHSDVAIDLRHVTIDYEAIEVLVGASRRVDERGGTLSVGGVTPEDEAVLRTHGLRLSCTRDRNRRRMATV